MAGDKEKDNDTKDRINAIIGIIILLLFGTIIGCLLDQALRPVKVRYYTPRKQANLFFKRFKEGAMLPFYYIIEYPKILMGINDDGSYGSPAPQAQTKQKRFIPINNLPSLRK